MKSRLSNLIKKRKTLYFVLTVALVSVFTLTIAYAALNTVLKITGNAEVVASSWDIYLDNVQLVNGSATSDVPIITDKNTASFYITLKNPGDYYMFTIDVVNNGSIDAMIDSIEKLPELSSEQAKYLNYVVEYQSGESINVRQLVEANSFVRLKVKVALRTDILSTDLPQNAQTLNLSFKVNYVQSDDSNSNTSIDNNGKIVKVVSGDGTGVGDEVCIDTECFYVISSTNDDVTMLTKYNLYVGGKYDGFTWVEYDDVITGRQDSTMVGHRDDLLISNGIIKFSYINYWSITQNTYPIYVYNQNTYFYEYIENYKIYLSSLDVDVKDVRLITYDELISLGCDGDVCSDAPNFVYSTSYWTGFAYNDNNVWCVDSNSDMDYANYSNNNRLGVRPVVVFSKDIFQ